MKAKARGRGAALLMGCLSLGCKASMNAEADVSGEGARGRAEAEVSGQAEGDGELRRSAPGPSGTASLVDGGAGSLGVERVLLGARHDLQLRPTKGTASCQCLAVALGGARNASMLWSAAPPDIDESTQLAIALSSESQTCGKEPKQSLGASYWGYRISGNDVIVLVEAARGGRPLTHGAIIPKPVGSGQVLVAPAVKSLPYGRALEGDGLCKIGNPGPPRSSPFTELEVGTDAPQKASGDGITGRARGMRLGDAPAARDDTPTTIELPSN